jgi:hypothetical protein
MARRFRQISLKRDFFFKDAKMNQKEVNITEKYYIMYPSYRSTSPLALGSRIGIASRITHHHRSHHQSPPLTTLHRNSTKISQLSRFSHFFFGCKRNHVKKRLVYTISPMLYLCFVFVSLVVVPNHYIIICWIDKSTKAQKSSLAYFSLSGTGHEASRATSQRATFSKEIEPWLSLSLSTKQYAFSEHDKP